MCRLCFTAPWPPALPESCARAGRTPPTGAVQPVTKPRRPAAQRRLDVMLQSLWKDVVVGLCLSRPARLEFPAGPVLSIPQPHISGRSAQLPLTSNTRLTAISPSNTTGLVQKLAPPLVNEILNVYLEARDVVPIPEARHCPLLACRFAAALLSRR